MSLWKKLMSNNKGLSLVELLVTMAIMSIVTAGIGTAVVSATRSYTNDSVEVDMQTDGQNLTNILTNLIIDSTKCSNSASDSEVANFNNLYITSVPEDVTTTVTTDGHETSVTNQVFTYYVIKFDESNNRILYGSSTVDYIDAANESNLVTLAENVKSFSADASSFSDDYTVHIDFRMYAQANKNSFNTSFSVTSRNAEGASAVVDANGAIIAVNTMMVIEPNQTLTRTYDILESGNVTGTTLGISVYDAKGNGTKITDGRLTVTDDGSGNLTIKASDDIKVNSENEDKALYIKLVTSTTNSEGKAYDTKWITVYVRRVINVSVIGVKTTRNISAGLEGAAYNINSSMSGDAVYNSDRFYSLSEDNDYICPYSVYWEVTCSDGGNCNPLDYIKFETGYGITDICDKSYSYSEKNGLVITTDSSTTLKIVFTNDLPTGGTITFKCTSAHSAGSYYGSGLFNKESVSSNTTTPYPNTGAICGSYTIRRAFFDDGFKRGTVTVTNHGIQANKGVNDYVTVQFTSKFGTNFAANADLVDVLKTVYQYSENYQTGVVTIDTQNAASGINFGTFYRIGTISYDATGAELVTWSPYRVLSTSANDKVDAKVAHRMIPCDNYYMEEIAVLYNTSTKKILYPYYPDLLATGMGFKELGYSFDENLMKYYFKDNVFKNGNYIFENDEFMLQSPVSRAAVYFAQGTQTISGKEYTVEQYQGTLGSLSNPIQINYNNGYASIALDQDFQGIYMESASTYNYDIGMILEKYDSVTGEWTEISNGNPVKTEKASYSIQSYTRSGYRIDFNYSSANDPVGSIYRIKLVLSNVDMTYIDGSGSPFTDDYNTLYPGSTSNINGNTIDESIDSSKYIASMSTTSSGKYTFPLYFTDSNGNDVGYIYFELTDTYLGDITFDSNGGSAVDTVIPIYQAMSYNKHLSDWCSSLPTPTREGYTFAGWYKDKTGGNQVTLGSQCSEFTSDTVLYAHWTRN